jgi:hypothetical protein
VLTADFWFLAPEPWCLWRPPLTPLAARGSLSGPVATAERPHRHDNNRAGEPANRWNDGIAASCSGPRRRIASGAPAAQQPTSGRSVALSNRAVASRCRPAHHRRHQHATSGGAVLAICAAVALSVSSAYAIRGAGAPGGARCTPVGAAPRADG